MCILRFFGTDGVRGIGHTGFLSDPYEEFISNRIFSSQLCNSIAISASRVALPGCVVVGWDRRPSNPIIVKNLLSKLRSTARRVLSLGETSTPALQFSMIENKAKLGIMITASHNPHEETGIKILFEGGRKPTLDEEAEIEGLIFVDMKERAPSEVENLNCEKYISNVREDLVSVRQYNSLEKTVLLVDGSGGWFATWLADVMNSVGIKCKEVSQRSSGLNENCGAGSLNEGDKFDWLSCKHSDHPLLNMAEPSDKGSLLGFCFDGDGDRCFLLASYGEGAQVIGGDGFLRLIHGLYRDSDGITLAVTLESNLDVVERFRASENSTVIETGIGDRWLQHALIERGGSEFTVGAEPSGHVVLEHKIGAEIAYYGDGIKTMIQFLRLLEFHGEDWFEIATESRYTKISRAIYPSNRTSWEPDGISGNSVINGLKKIFGVDSSQLIRRHIQGEESLLYLTIDVEEKWSIAIRNSGTEPKTRITIRTTCIENGKVESVMLNLVDILERYLK